nr:MAG TPA: hypothetical protein [Caudoviricetes sp.]
MLETSQSKKARSMRAFISFYPMLQLPALSTRKELQWP